MTSKQAAEDYTSHEQLLIHLNGCFRQMGFNGKTRKDYDAWAPQARAKLIELLGIHHMVGASPQPRMTESVNCGDFTRERWVIRTEEHVLMPFYILRPRNLTGRSGAVICLAGHGSGGKISIAGVSDEQDPAVKERYKGAYGVQMARAGMLSVCPDSRGFGERREDPKSKITDSSCKQLQMMGLPQGISVMGMMAFDMMRLVDYLQTRDDVAADRIGCCGFSGGGWQAIATAAVDTRVACTVTGGYFYGVKEALFDRPGNCPCNLVPHLWEHFDMGDFGALIAPRPFLVESGRKDELAGEHGLENVYPQVKIAASAYQALGAADKIHHCVHEGGHQWSGQEAIPWMKKWIVA